MYLRDFCRGFFDGVVNLDLSLWGFVEHFSLGLMVLAFRRGGVFLEGNSLPPTSPALPTVARSALQVVAPLVVGLLDSRSPPLVAVSPLVVVSVGPGPQVLVIPPVVGLVDPVGAAHVPLLHSLVARSCCCGSWFVSIAASGVRRPVPAGTINLGAKISSWSENSK